MTTIALLSDVHANLAALEAVLAALPAVDRIWAMGDTVGYGPDPSDVIALLGERNALMVAGNHDLAAATGAGVEMFNPWAAAAVRLHHAWLSAEERDLLAGLPLTAEAGGFTLCHGSLRDPVWEYVTTVGQAAATLRIATTPHCCNGHTHVPALFRVPAADAPRSAAEKYGPSSSAAGAPRSAAEKQHSSAAGAPRSAAERYGPSSSAADAPRWAAERQHSSAAGAPRSAAAVTRSAIVNDRPLPLGGRCLVNPGSVGQPRDADARAAYALLDIDAGTVTFKRATYDVAATQRRIRARGLPDVLAERLAVGF